MKAYVPLKNFGLLILLFNTSVVFAQEVNPKVDSMVQRLEVITGEEEFEVLKDLFAYYYSNDFEKALKYANRAYDFSLSNAKIHGDSNVVRASRMKGVVLKEIGRVNEAIEIFNEALLVARKNNFTKLSKFLLTDLGNVHNSIGRYDKALQYQFETLEIRKAQGIKDEISLTLMNIGLIYYRLGNYKMAKEYYIKSLKLYEEISEKHGFDDLLINIGFLYYNLEEFDSAISYLNQGLNFCKVECSNSILMSGNNGLGLANLGLKKYKDAEKFLLNSLNLSITSGSVRTQGHNLLSLALLNFERGNDHKALDLLKKSEELLFRGGYNDLMINIYKKFSNHYFQSKEFEKAAQYQNKYIKLKDSLMGNELAQNLAAIQSEYEQRSHNNAMAQKDELLQQQRYLTYAIAAIAILVILVIFIVIRIYWLKIKQSQQQQLLQVEAQATEREREHLAKELHDGVGTDLMATKLHVMSLLNQPSITASSKQEIEEQFQSITKTVRNISYGLTPPGLDRFGLFNALSNYIRKINESSEIAIHLNNNGADHKKGAATIAIFRILQELITNSLKHSLAKNIRITIESFDDLINILFEDDGKGFSPATVKRGLGLSNIESRIKSLGGTIALESGTVGTFYSIDIPLKNQ